MSRISLIRIVVGVFFGGAVAFFMPIGKVSLPPSLIEVRPMGTPEATDWLNPTGRGLRGCDAHGCGHFGAPRGTRLHSGVDFTALSGDIIKAMHSGHVSRIGWSYQNEPYRYVEIKTAEGYLVRHMYVKPLKSIQPGMYIGVGEPIGTAQSLKPKYPRIVNHIHVDVSKNGRYIDPTTLITIM